MGRPSFRPSESQRRQVETMAGYGVPQDDIARVTGIDPKTLRKHFPEELATGSTKANAKVAESLFKKAVGDGPSSVTAAIFWAKTRMGWKEAPTALELTGKDGGPIQTQTVDPKKLSSGALAELLAARDAGSDE